MREAWRRFRLDELCDISKGSHPLEKTKPGTYPLVGTAKAWRTSETFDFEGQAVCIPLVSSTGHGDASLKRLHFAEGKVAAATIVGAAVVRDPGMVEGRFLYHFLSLNKDRLIVSLMQGTANMSLKVADLANVPIDLPPLPEQRRIVDLIGAVDAQIEAADHAVERAERARRGLLSELLAPAMREGWRRVPLGEAATLSIGRTPPRKEARYWSSADDRPFCTVADLVQGRLVGTREGVTEEAEAEGVARRVPAGTLLMSFKLTIGRLAITNVDVFPNEAIVAINPRVDAASPGFLMLALSGQNLEAYSGRAVMGRTLNRASLEAIPIDLPPLPEQRRIVDLIGAADSEIGALKAVADQARELRKGLLTELLSGDHEIPASYDRLLAA